jgi:hypothetical protein
MVGQEQFSDIDSGSSGCLNQHQTAGRNNPCCGCVVCRGKKGDRWKQQEESEEEEEEVRAS